MELMKIRTTAEFIPLRNVFRKFFELPNILDESLTFMNALENQKLIINFIQGSFWKERKTLLAPKIVLPLFLHFDDYETNNPLGSHAGVSKCCAVYVSIPGLPDYMRSKLPNIFLFVLFNTLDRKDFKNESIFLSYI